MFTLRPGLCNGQPSQNVFEEQVVLKVETVWLPLAPNRVPEGHEPLGGSGNLDTRRCNLVQSGGVLK